jgi:hypothetical protein
MFYNERVTNWLLRLSIYCEIFSRSSQLKGSWDYQAISFEWYIIVHIYECMANFLGHISIVLLVGIMIRGRQVN